MVLQKKSDYGSSGYHVPAMPQVPKSARGKRSVRKKVEDNLMCAFDLLATVAGSMLQGENSPCPADFVGTSNSITRKESIKQEQEDYEKLSRAEAFDRHSSNENIQDPSAFEGHTGNALNEHSLVMKAVQRFDSVSKISNHEVKATEPITLNNKDEDGHDAAARTNKWQTLNSSSSSDESHKLNGVGIKTPLKNEKGIVSNIFDENTPETNSSDDPMDLDTKPPLLSSDNTAGVPQCRNKIHYSSVPKVEDGMELVDKDDDENSSGCTHTSILSTKACRPQRIGDRRIRKLLASKYWKVPSQTLQGHEFSNYDVESKPVPRSKKMCYTRQRTQKSCFKRRRLVERYSRSIPIDNLRNLCKKGAVKYEEGDATETLPGACGASSSSGKKTAYNSSDYHVKLKIKSFKVPELFIDIPETATVGSLKQTVLDAVTAILEGGLHIGVLLQGKKVRDENKTLRQAGISQGGQLDSLGFILEPNTTINPPLTCNEDPDFIGIADVAEPLARLPPIAPAVEDHGDTGSALQHVLTPCHESDHGSVHSPNDSLILDEKESNSRALVVVPPVNTDALAVVVPQRKSRRTEAVQRRIRRPFTVGEVEALVQAVEKLGTGRWRDVKLRAFDNAKHRTYVDLKDKWKTLVHTARISPQQRRGEPVPQELLDRVLSAHAYWSQQQAKLQLKPPTNVEPLSVLN